VLTGETPTILIRVEPVEYQKKVSVGKNPRIIRYRNLVKLFPISIEKLKENVKHTRTKKVVTVEQYSTNHIAYQYGRKPQIILNTETAATFVTEKTFERHGERACQQQASILMRLLKDYYLINFVRVSNTLNPYRIGKNADDREITYRAFKHLMNDPIK
jgi:hypothetical protein